MKKTKVICVGILFVFYCYNIQGQNFASLSLNELEIELKSLFKDTLKGFEWEEEVRYSKLLKEFRIRKSREALKKVLDFSLWYENIYFATEDQKRTAYGKKERYLIPEIESTIFSLRMDSLKLNLKEKLLLIKDNVISISSEKINKEPYFSKYYNSLSPLTIDREKLYLEENAVEFKHVLLSELKECNNCNRDYEIILLLAIASIDDFEVTSLMVHHQLYKFPNYHVGINPTLIKMKTNISLEYFIELVSREILLGNTSTIDWLVEGTYSAFFEPRFADNSQSIKVIKLLKEYGSRNISFRNKLWFLLSRVVNHNSLAYFDGLQREPLAKRYYDQLFIFISKDL